MPTNFIKIRVGQCFVTRSPEERFTGAFRDRLYPVEEKIRSMIILQLNEAIGLHNWAVYFDPTPDSKGYVVDIWADSREEGARVFSIISDRLKDYNINSPLYRGTVDQRLN